MEREIGTQLAVNARGERVRLRRFEVLMYDPTLTGHGGVVGWLPIGEFRLKLQNGDPVVWIDGKTLEVFGTGERLTLI